MTNEKLDQARVKEAQRLFLDGIDESPTILIAARLAREGWTPPEPVDPDETEAKGISTKIYDTNKATFYNAAFMGIKRGRELERDAADVEIDQLQETVMKLTEAKPGMVWVKHDGSKVCPIDIHQHVLVTNINGFYIDAVAGTFQWHRVTHYAIITQPEEK